MSTTIPTSTDPAFWADLTPATIPADLHPRNSALHPLEARWAGVCDACTEEIAAGALVYYSGATGPLHPWCIAFKTPEEIAVEAEAAKAERARVRKERAAVRKRREALLLETSLERYGHGMDSRNSELCSRCGGGGYFPFAVYQGKCFKCHGLGRTLRAQITQPRGLKQRAVDLNTAWVGDIISDGGGTYYEVTEVRWFRQAHARYDAQGASIFYNQTVHARRVIDGERYRFYREVFEKPLGQPTASWEQGVAVSRLMHGALATRDPETGRWVTRDDPPLRDEDANAWDRAHAESTRTDTRFATDDGRDEAPAKEGTPRDA